MVENKKYRPVRFVNWDGYQTLIEALAKKIGELDFSYVCGDWIQFPWEV